MKKFLFSASIGTALLATPQSLTAEGDVKSYTDTELVNRFCPSTRVSDKRGNLERRYNRFYWDNLPQTISASQFNDTAKKVLQSAENSVYELTRLERDAIRLSLESTRERILEEIRQQPNAFADPNGNEGELSERIRQRVAKAQLRYIRELVSEETQWQAAQNNYEGHERFRMKIYERVMVRCGANGLEVDHFTTPRSGAFPEDSLILCPGFVISMDDVQDGPFRSEAPAALTFAFGTLLGAIIQDEVQSSWLTAVKEGRVDLEHARQRLSAHKHFYDPYYWGSLVLADSMKAFDTKDRERIAIWALDGVCSKLSNPKAREDREKAISYILLETPLAPALGLD